jgi:hypothetical protein
MGVQVPPPTPDNVQVDGHIKLDNRATVLPPGQDEVLCSGVAYRSGQVPNEPPVFDAPIWPADPMSLGSITVEECGFESRRARASRRPFEDLRNCAVYPDSVLGPSARAIACRVSTRRRQSGWTRSTTTRNPKARRDACRAMGGRRTRVVVACAGSLWSFRIRAGCCKYIAVSCRRFRVFKHVHNPHFAYGYLDDNAGARQWC